LDASAYQTLKRLYLEARERRGDERVRFVEAACAGDASLRAELEELLAEGDALGPFLERPAKVESGEDAPEPISHPARIGAYRILEPIGWGGMGVVYLAEQESPHRQVALKLLRHDAASPAQLARFQREAELLGRLNHPGIARVYEAAWAETETGRRPFFAMEHVQGRSLSDYVNEQEISLRERLQLVCQVAEAVHYAHERGVVHRDLKPSNVVVDDRGQPRVLDFGVARPLGVDSSATQTGQLVGTLAYMSPEQATGKAQLDARSDVYSLGVLLYELLTGRLPIATESLPLHEAVRRIQTEDPISAGSIRRELKGDLETILDKALAREPGRRYATAADFAEDLRLFLDHRPIRARRPTSWYVGWKLVRRHRTLAAAVVALFLALSAAQYVSLRLVQRSREFQRTAEQRTFYRQLLALQLERQKLTDLEQRAEVLKGLGAPRTKDLEDWVHEAEVVSGELERHRQELEALRAAHGAPGPGTPEEREMALDTQTELVERVEFLSGPRGLLPEMQARLEAQRAREALARGGEQHP